jgi:hypothetical protein
VEHVADMGNKYENFSENLGKEDYMKKRLVEELITKFILNKFRENIHRTELARGPFERK